MIRVYYGENRVAAMDAARKVLGGDYEIVEGADLTPDDLPSLLKGVSLFAAERKILVRDILANRALGDVLPKYVDTPHEVVFLEMKVDKRSSGYKGLKDLVEWQEFKMPVDPNKNLVFEVYKTAKRDGAKAVELLRKIEEGQEPMMFLGLMVTQAVRDYSARPGVKEKRALKELSKLDMELKSSKMPSWLLIESFLLRLKA